MTKEEAMAEAAEQLRQHPEWALIVENPRFFACPLHITTAEEAFTALGHYLWRWSRPNPVADQIDQRLAAFAKAKPGTLEALLADPERQQILAMRKAESMPRSAVISRSLVGVPHRS